MRNRLIRMGVFLLGLCFSSWLTAGLYTAKTPSCQLEQWFCRQEFVRAAR